MQESDKLLNRFKDNEIKRSKWLTRYLVGISVLLLGFMIWLKLDSATSIKGLEGLASSTNAVVTKQNETLEAIKQVTTDNKITTEQQTTIIICMLQVPLAQRTTDTEESCRKNAEAAQTGTTSQSTPSTPVVNSPTPSNQSTQSPTPPEEQNPPIATTPAPDNSILPGDQSPVIGCVNLPFQNRICL